MPTRVEKTTKSKATQDYTYEDLLLRIRTHIDDKYGGVALFLQHKDYLKCGFDEAENAKMYTYLALPREGNDGARVKSFPAMKKLFKGLLGIELENHIKVERKQMISGNAEKINSLPTEPTPAEMTG